MALLPILTLLDTAKDASSLLVVDGTGNYSSTNTGGFGTPNPLKANVTGAILSLYTICNPNVLVNFRLTTTAFVLDAGQTISANSFPGITSGSVFKDGVYGIKYNLLYLQSLTLAFTAGSSVFTVTGAATIFAAAVGFVLGNNSTIYYIDRTKALDSSGGSIIGTFDTTGARGAFEVCYAGDLKILVDKAGNKCLVEDIGIWANAGCKDDNFKDIWTRYKQRVAMQSKFTQGYLNDADKLAHNLSNYCDCQTPYIPCSC